MASAPLHSYVLRNAEPAEEIATRTKQMVELARYARLGVPGELLGWDDVDLVRFHELHQALAGLSGGESPLQSLAEDY